MKRVILWSEFQRMCDERYRANLRAAAAARQQPLMEHSP